MSWVRFSEDLQMAAYVIVVDLVVLWVLVFRSPVGGCHTHSHA